MTDHSGSSDADVLVFEIEEGRVGRKLALLPVVIAARPDLGREVRRHGHRYLELIRWTGTDRLRLDVGLDGSVWMITPR